MDLSTALDLQDMQRELDAGNMIKVPCEGSYIWIWKEEEKICTLFNNDPDMTSDVKLDFETLEHVILFNFFHGATVIEKEK